MTAQEMWHQYCQARGLDPAAPYKTRSFGSGDFADGLARLILCGKKRATTAARIAFESSGTPLPQPGEHTVILYGDGSAAGIIQNTRVRLLPFDQVPELHAWHEGPGVDSLNLWRPVHQALFTQDYRAAGLDFDPQGLCVLTDFQLVYPLPGCCIT